MSIIFWVTDGFGDGGARLTGATGVISRIIAFAEIKAVRVLIPTKQTLTSFEQIRRGGDHPGVYDSFLWYALG